VGKGDNQMTESARGRKFGDNSRRYTILGKGGENRGAILIGKRQLSNHEERFPVMQSLDDGKLPWKEILRSQRGGEKRGQQERIAIPLN